MQPDHRTTQRKSISSGRTGRFLDPDDYLTGASKEIDEKYDYHYSVLIMVFGIPLKQRWLKSEDLEGLSGEKIERIISLAKIQAS